MPEIILRPYQEKFIDAVREQFKRTRRVVGVAPCGSGKTIMTGWMIRQSLKNGKRSIFFVHRKELIEQTAKTFDDLHIPYGIIAAEHKMNSDALVQIASVQTLAKRIDKIQPPDFLICDECHHILANTYKRIIDAFPNAFLLGVTATPQRTGGITLCDVFDSMVESLTVQELIDLGALTPFKYFAPAIGVDLRRVRQKFGEYVNSDLEEIMTDKRIIGGIVGNYQKLAGGKSAICYCVNVYHSKLVAEAFNNAGISAAQVDAETDKNLRNAIVADFREGNIKVLCNAELFGEGFDVPHCQAVILARPTNSLTLYIQQSMRSMRPNPDDPNKVAIIIDHVQNYARHGLPNEPHEWTLEPNKPHKRKCPQCKKWVKPDILPDKKSKCPNCGFVFLKSVERDGEYHEPDISEYSGELSAIDTNHETKNPATVTRIIQAPKSPEDFLEIAKKRNYKIGWVAMQSIEFAQSYEDFLHIADVCGYKQGWAFHKWQEHKAEFFDENVLQNARQMC